MSRPGSGLSAKPLIARTEAASTITDVQSSSFIQHRPVQPPPQTGLRLAGHRRCAVAWRDTARRRQMPPRTPAGQHVHHGGERCPLIQQCRTTALLTSAARGLDKALQYRHQILSGFLARTRFALNKTGRNLTDMEFTIRVGLVDPVHHPLSREPRKTRCPIGLPRGGTCRVPVRRPPDLVPRSEDVLLVSDASVAPAA